MSGAALDICPDCQVALPKVGGERHAYLGGSASCWAYYGEVLAREYADPAYMAVHRLTVDAYSAQHPGKPERRTIKSVTVHLAGLCLTLEHAAAPTTVRRAMARLADSAALVWLEPPATLGTVRVDHVLVAADAADHGRRVRQWAASVWDAWRVHHDRIRRLIATA